MSDDLLIQPDTGIKVAILTPSLGHITSRTTQDLMRLVRYTTQKCPTVRLGFFDAQGSILSNLRNDMATDALGEWQADYTLWVDSDMRFPKESLQVLLSHAKPFIGVNYVTKQNEPRPTAVGFDPTGTELFPVASEPGMGVRPVNGIGFGLCLIHRSVYENTPKPWFTNPVMPDRSYSMGEDTAFCIAVRASGMSIYCDHDLSRAIRHVGTFEYNWANYDSMVKFYARQAELNTPTESSSDETASGQ